MAPLAALRLRIRSLEVRTHRLVFHFRTSSWIDSLSFSELKSDDEDQGFASPLLPLPPSLTHFRLRHLHRQPLQSQADLMEPQVISPSLSVNKDSNLIFFLDAIGSSSISELSCTKVYSPSWNATTWFPLSVVFSFFFCFSHFNLDFCNWRNSGFCGNRRNRSWRDRPSPITCPARASSVRSAPAPACSSPRPRFLLLLCLSPHFYCFRQKEHYLD